VNTWTVLAYLVVSVVLVVWADRWDGRRHPCGCKWPTGEDGPAVATCPCGVTYEYRVVHDWRGRQRDAWDRAEPSEGEKR